MTAVQLVRSATRLAPVPFVPEVRLHQVGDIWALWERTERELGQSGLPPPFWGVAWPGGRVLARYLLDHPDLVAGRSVLDVGSGSGLVAIAAAKAGAARVLAAETDPVARAAIELNAAANAVAAPACVDSARDCLAAANVVVAGDVWYERELANQVTACFACAAAAGALVLAGDIGRRYFPRQRYLRLVSYELQATMDLEGRQRVTASVWQASQGAQRAAGRVERYDALPAVREIARTIDGVDRQGELSA
jgi:predicted nicotinamide N-methyase